MLVLDMQVITPAVGGGRLRLLGLYHGFGSELPTTYVGTYDWPGEQPRDVQLTPSLREVIVPLSPQTFAAHEELSRRVGGRVLIDTAFHRVVQHSAEFVDRVRRELREADIVVCSHPWVYPLIAGQIDKNRQLLVYDAHNVEGFLRLQLLDDGGFGSEIAEDVVRVELGLCHASDLVFCCSHEDLSVFNSEYDIPLRKLRIAPNGAFTDQIRPPGRNARLEIRERLKLVHPSIAVFVGSEYGPNVEAARFLIEEVAPQIPSTLFVIAGGVGGALVADKCPPYRLASNVHVTGQLTDSEKLDWLQCSDLAVNPMFSGSGTNIKMFDFLAAGLPVISTDIGARGIPWRDESCIRVASAEEFAATVRETLGLPNTLAALGLEARELAERSFSWEHISPLTGLVMREHFRRLRTPPAKVTVVLPARASLSAYAALLESLRAQTRKDFEVVLVRSLPVIPLHRDPLPFFLMEGSTHATDLGSIMELALALANGAQIVFLSTDWPLEPSFVERLLSNGSPKTDGLFVTDDLRRLDNPFVQAGAGKLEPLERRPLAVKVASLLGLPFQDFRHRIESLSAYFPADGEHKPEFPICESKFEAMCRWLDSGGGGPWQLGPLGPSTRGDGAHTIVILEDLLSSQDFVTELYRRLLGRDPDALGASHYNDILATGKASRADVIDEILQSAECRRRQVRVVSHAESIEHLRHFGELYLGS